MAGAGLDAQQYGRGAALSALQFGSELVAVPGHDAIVAIREHAEAGALLRQLEAWLHMPTPPAEADWQALLAPYRSVTAASFEPIAAKESR